jgi:ABC-type multidrug transport system permease subunit
MESILRKHPIAVVFYLLYSWLCYSLISAKFKFEETIKQHPDISHNVAGGETIGQISVLLSMVTIIFFVISGCCAIGSKTQTKFYLWLCLVVIVQTFVVFRIG